MIKGQNIQRFLMKIMFSSSMFNMNKRDLTRDEVIYKQNIKINVQSWRKVGSGS